LLIRIHLEMSVDLTRFQPLFDFLLQWRLAEPGATVALRGPFAESAPPIDPRFSLAPDRAEERADLEVAFLDFELARNNALIKRIGDPKLLVGSRGLPVALDHVCVPFEGKRFRVEWLKRIIETAAKKGFKVRLIHCDHGIVAHEILALADWFRLDAVKDALTHWLTEDMQLALRDLIAEHPGIEVKTRIGRLRSLFVDEDPANTLVMGSIGHANLLARRYHGVHYGALLTHTGVSGYFLPESPPPLRRILARRD